MRQAFLNYEDSDAIVVFDFFFFFSNERRKVVYFFPTLSKREPRKISRKQFTYVIYFCRLYNSYPSK